MKYCGRFAPTPTGFLHLGHARTFWIAQKRCRAAGGTMLYRNEDLDATRCKREFHAAGLEDCRWLGLEWQGEPVNQSDRMNLYEQAFRKLKSTGHLFSCTCTRKDIQEATTAPHSEEGEILYPGTCRQTAVTSETQPTNWRFRVPNGKVIKFQDGHFGPQRFVAGRDFSDFPVWQKSGVPAYQLAVVVDDAGMGITEVVRGADLLMSTARQLLLYETLKLTPPAFFHCELMCDENGQRLAKRHDISSLRNLRDQGKSPGELQADW